MAYDKELEHKIDSLTKDWHLTKKKIFGGLGYFLGDKMPFVIMGDNLLFRVPDEKIDKLHERKGIIHAVMGKRVMKHWLLAGGEAIATDKSLRQLLKIGHIYVVELLEAEK